MGGIFDSKVPTLCSPCQKLRIQLLPDPEEEPVKKWTGYRHSTAQQLLTTSVRCPLCAIIKRSFEHVGAYVSSREIVEEHLSCFADSTILLRAGRQGTYRNKNGSASLASVDVLLASGLNRLKGSFGLYALPGESAYL